MSAPKLKILDVVLSERPVTMRLPFQFGNTEMRETAEIYCRIETEIAGRVLRGYSAQLMVPRWFDKRTTLSNEDTVNELRRISGIAAGLANGQSGTVASLSQNLREAVPQQLNPDMPALAAGFGPALLEMALIDAACHAAGLPFWRAAQADIFGLSRHLPADLPKDRFLSVMKGIGAPEQINLRHTIGFDAPLRDRPQDAPQDGLPVTVTEVSHATGIRAWKIKLKGDPERDAARLTELQTILGGRMQGGVTLDANEQYTPDAFRVLLDRLARNDLAEISSRIRFFEQPFARETALETLADFGVPLVIDESDDSLDALPRALALGWAGTSIKSCKGVLRALVNMARAKAAGAILSGEDLTCQPGLCWTQDSAMAAACGVRDVERNGHHFAGGLQGAGPAEQQAMLSAHGDIFRRQDGRIELAIGTGRVRIASLDRPGFGASGVLDMAS
ncbi:enolase C-terminal domain-like protein [Paracoccus methylarcula]|uniref:Enolase C-terminal domain-containing protein n=1 Tax=Paracoccus methylarcula TaxID=72022 RepID=A0A3R7Q106_9RHOB|nr:enolase C-terminal domain-like protein [Paracoccus methylarcula]RNF33310.1 hypothetical protein A7A09_018020 [Paracoccus methylarcula]